MAHAINPPSQTQDTSTPLEELRHHLPIPDPGANIPDASFQLQNHGRLGRKDGRYSASDDALAISEPSTVETQPSSEPPNTSSDPLNQPARKVNGIPTAPPNPAAPDSEASAATAETTTRPPLPELPYSLREHKRNIAIIWSLLALDAAIMPLVLFYPLWYSSDLAPAYIFAVTTGLFGIISGLEWAYRSWRLWRQEWVRPFGGKKNGFDFFHISYTIGYTIALIELIVGAAPHDPFVRLCAMPAPSFIVFFGGELLFFSILHTLHCQTPFQISSLPKGVPVRPMTYTILEDVIAVDTGAGRAYRKALNDRYEASHGFRVLLHRVDLFWSVPALLVGVACMVVAGVPQVPQTVGYGIGWGVPPLWVGLWAVITTYSVQHFLRKEREEWEKGGGSV